MASALGKRNQLYFVRSIYKGTGGYALRSVSLIQGLGHNSWEEGQGRLERGDG